MISDSTLNICIKAIQKRQQSDGGFTEQEKGSYRPDSTAWAALALSRAGITGEIVDAARLSLTNTQLEDGRVCMPGEPGAFWPTSLSVLAWKGSKAHGEQQGRAVRFLLETSGKHWKKGTDSPVSHDTSIRGWPWIENTHSFVEPTALALIALEISGHTGHPRFQEGLRMLMDRQLADGGWNYGNTIVYGKELYPFVDTTGMTLVALAGHIKREHVNKSILFLKSQAEGYRSPLSLGWALFGLGTWGELPKRGREWIEESLKRQKKYGAYGTSLLSLLALVSICQGEFRKCVV